MAQQSFVTHRPKFACRLTPGWEPVVGPAGRNVQQWLDTGQAQLVKQGWARSIYRVDLPQQTLFIKHYAARRWQDWLRQLLRGSPARREWRKAREVARRGIPTAVPVGFGERDGLVARETWYASEGIAGAQSLDDFLVGTLAHLPPKEQSSRRREILHAMGRLVARMHDQGIFHNDLHTGNILVRFAGQNGHEARAELFLIDLAGVRIGKPLGWRPSQRSLAMLAAAWMPRLTQTDQLRFWSSYVSARHRLPEKFPPDAIAQIRAQAQRHARRIAAMRDKRSLQTNRDFQRLQTAKARAYAVKEIPSEQLSALLADPRAPLRAFRHEAVKIGHGSLLVKARMRVSEGWVDVAYKRSRTGPWWKRILGVVRRSRAVAAWHTAHALLLRGIATARPLAAIEPRNRWAPDSILITQWIPGALNLHLYGWQLAKQPSPARHRRALQAAEGLGKLVGRLHSWHIAHRDLKGCNLLLAEQPRSVDAYLIDLDGVRFRRRLRPQDRAKDIARLAAAATAHPWVSRTVRLRFLRAYLRASGIQRQQWKQYWRQIDRHCQCILARFRRRGTPAA